MKADGKVVMSEISYCEKVAESFGFTAQSIGFLSGSLNDNPRIDPNFELIKSILEPCPELLFLVDKRGFTALSYIPQSCWPEWCGFLKQESTFLRDNVNHSGYVHSRDQLNEAEQRLQLLLQRASDF